MSEHHDNDDEAAQLGRVNSDLSRGLKRCSGMVRDYRARLIAANSNDIDFMLGSDHSEAKDGERTG